MNEEQLAFLADPGVLDGQVVQTIIPNNAAFQTEDLNTYNSNCDDISNAQEVLMANISNYGSDIILEVPHSEANLNDIENQSVHAMQNFEQTPAVNFSDNEIHSDSNIIFREKMIDSQIDDMIKEKLALKEQIDSLELNLSKQIKEKDCLLLSEYFGKRLTPQQEMDAEQAFWLRISNPTNKPSDASPVKIKAPKEIPKHMESLRESIQEKAKHKREYDRRMNDRMMQSKEGNADSSKALDAGLVITKSNETESERHVSSSRSRKDTYAEDADINSVNDKQPIAEVQLTVKHNILANEQQHYEQSESIYDTYLLEMVDRNTTPDSTDMSHRGGEIEQNAVKYQVSYPLLYPSFDNMTTEFSYQSLKSENISLKKTVAQLQKDLSRMEAHCVNMELKYQNQALKDRQHGQIFNETSNKAKIKKEIEVLETINIELEHSVAKLLEENEKFHKKNNKTVENADSKAQIQEIFFANVALKNELRKLKGNSVDTKFAKPSILGKPVLQPPINQSVVRQLIAFKSKQPNFSKPRFASQVDVNNDLPKLVTPHYFPQVREYVLVKPHHVIALGSSRNSFRESYGSNDMAHNYYLEEAKKKTQDKNRNLKPREMPSARTHHSPNTYTPKPRSNNQTSSNWHASKSSEETLKAMQKADHSKNPSSFLDSKCFVCSTCQKCIFNANHDACITKFLKEVNSRVKVQSSKTRNSNKPVEPKIHTQKPGKQIVTRHRFYPNKSSAVHEKTNTPRSCLSSLEPTLHEMTPATISSGLVPNPPPSTPFVPPSRTDWDILFQPLFDELLNPPSSVDRPTPEVIAPIAKVVAPEPAASTGSPSSTTVDQDTPSPNVAYMNNNPFFGILIPENNSEASSSSDVIPTIVHTAAPYSEHVTK
ncbi:hypothetical protein Tco_0222462 [Tanacetum coccineum]